VRGDDLGKFFGQPTQFSTYAAMQCPQIETLGYRRLVRLANQTRMRLAFWTGQALAYRSLVVLARKTRLRLALWPLSGPGRTPLHSSLVRHCIILASHQVARKSGVAGSRGNPGTGRTDATAIFFARAASGLRHLR
jgi:hypothetical protein